MVGTPIANDTIRRLTRVVALVAIAWALVAAGADFIGRGAAAADEADLERGQTLYKLCIKCHGVDGAGNPEALAPPIAGMPSWYVEAQLKNFKNGLRGLHHEDTGGLRMYPMSQWLRDEADQKSVAAYVAAMPPVEIDHTLDDEGNPAQGAGYYAVCSACHGAAGEGNPGMGAPPLVGQPDWYLYKSIKKYKNKVRGSAPGDPYGAAMQGMVATLPNDDAIHDVIAHIKTFESAPAKAQ